jgi:DNA-binding transcriptional regulator YiaG
MPTFNATEKVGTPTVQQKPKGKSKIKLQIEEWKSRSPFRVWRLSHGLSMRDAAATVGVNLYTIQAWENGSAYPKPENMATLIQLTEDTELRDKWIEWWKDGPEGKGSKPVAKGVLYQ